MSVKLCGSSCFWVKQMRFSALATTLLAYIQIITIPALLLAVAWCLWLRLPWARDRTEREWPHREWPSCLQLSWGHCNPSGTPRTQLIFPLPPPSLFLFLSVFTLHSHWGCGAIRKQYHKTSKINFGKKISIKEFRAPDAKYWFSENPVHWQVATKPGQMPSVHQLQTRERSLLNC